MSSAHWALEHDWRALHLRASLNAFSSKLPGSRVTNNLLAFPSPVEPSFVHPRCPEAVFCVCSSLGDLWISWLSNTTHTLALQTSIFYSPSLEPRADSSVLTIGHSLHTPGPTLHYEPIPLHSNSSFSGLCHSSGWYLAQQRTEQITVIAIFFSFFKFHLNQSFKLCWLYIWNTCQFRWLSHHFFWWLLYSLPSLYFSCLLISHIFI